MLNRVIGLALLAGIAAVHWAPIKNRKGAALMLAGGLILLHRRPIGMLFGDLTRTADKLLTQTERKRDELR